MGTHSIISRKVQEGYLGIYCHWDGYPSYNGEILLNHYCDDAKVIELINLGNLSALAPECSLPEGKAHSYDKPVEGYTIAYHRDRGESWEHCKPKIIRPFQEDHQDWGQEYVYLWNGTQWLVSAYMYPENKCLYVFPLADVFAYSQEINASVDNSKIFRHMAKNRADLSAEYIL